MLMTKYKFLIVYYNSGNHIVVTRLEDGAQKYFYQAGGDNTVGMTRFFESMPDELVAGYFPKTDKKGNDTVDNWAFLGANHGRAVAEQRARES